MEINYMRKETEQGTNEVEEIPSKNEYPSIVVTMVAREI
jgi:hypothetical protein